MKYEVALVSIAVAHQTETQQAFYAAAMLRQIGGNQRSAPMLSRRKLVALTLVAAAAGLGYVNLGRLMKPEVFTGLVPGVALGGYDAVSYFAEAAPRPGREDLTLLHAGVVWRFASEANRDIFRADPARYAPRYGGYCAYAVAGGGAAGADPRFWRIVDGRLYLNASRRVHEKWERNPAGYIAKADANWPRVLRWG